jgi:hypothetical protein
LDSSQDSDLPQADVPEVVRKEKTMDFLPPVHEIAMVVAGELPSAGEPEVALSKDGQQLFLRAILPITCTPRKRDVVQGGVAVKTADREIHVRHYTFRQVCTNGAIMPVMMYARDIRRVTFAAPTDEIENVITELRQAVQVCAHPRIFANVATQLRFAARQDVGRALDWLPQLGHGRGGIVDMLRWRIEHEFRRAGDPSLYGAMNAVTAVAQRIRNQELRWHLEQLGGAIPSGSVSEVRIFAGRCDFSRV